MMLLLLFLATVPIFILAVVYLMFRRFRRAEEQAALELLALVKEQELQRADEKRWAEEDRRRWEAEGGTWEKEWDGTK